MDRLLTLLARPSTRRPGLTLSLLLLITVGFAIAATNLVMQTDMASFGAEDSEVVQGLDRVRDEFDRGSAALQVTVDAGPEGDVLTPDGLATLVTVEETLLGELDGQVRTDAQGRPRLYTLSTPLLEVLAAQGVELADADGRRIGAATTAALTEQPRLTALLSADLDAAKGQARATTVLVELDPELTTEQRLDALDRVRADLGIEEGELRGELDGMRVTVNSPEGTNAALESETQSEAPMLLLLALLAVIVVLGVLLRSAFDVMVGMLALAATLIWTFGIIAILGPGVLDLLGPLSQIGVVVPVLIIGLGIDYAVHLLSRYHEQRATGQVPSLAAAASMGTVGTALVLATVATAAGFAMTGLAPLSVIADFGIFTAIGVVVALVVMGGAVPAARVLRDRRGASTAPTPETKAGIGQLLARPTHLAVTHPVPLVLTGLVLLILGAVAANGLETRFDRADFIPEDSPIGEVVADQDLLFDGALTETTYVLVDADLTDPGMLAALREAHARLADVDLVRSDPDGTPQATSIVTLLDQLPDAPTDLEDLEGREQLLTGAAGTELARLVRDDRQAAVVELRTNAGDGQAAALAADVQDAFAPVRDLGGAILVTSDEQIIGEMADDLRDFQVLSIALTLATVLLLLVLYYGVGHRRPLLGVIAMIPSVVGTALLLGTMALLDVSFDALTATLTAIAVGIGVPYGVHVTNRFEEDLRGATDIEAALHRTLATTGGALLGSALTTFAAFVVLSFSGLALISRMGALGAAGITYALLAAVVIQPAALVLWARRGHPAPNRTTTTAVPAWQLVGSDNETPTTRPTPDAPRAAPEPAHSTAEVTGAWELRIDDSRSVPYRVELAGTNGTTAIRSITINARPGHPLDPQHLDEGALHAIMELTLSYAAGATRPQQPDDTGPSDR
ncbi:MAG: efflux RND transporter permease subunit [Nitriliruptoraceae bacterium]